MNAILETIINPIAKRRRDRYGGELTNGGRRHRWVTSQSCVAVLQKFEFTIPNEDHDVGGRAPGYFFAAVFEVSFRFAGKSWVVQTKMSNLREMRARIAYAYGNRFINDREFVLLYNGYRSANPDFPSWNYFRRENKRGMQGRVSCRQ